MEWTSAGVCGHSLIAELSILDTVTDHFKKRKKACENYFLQRHFCRDGRIKAIFFDYIRDRSISDMDYRR
jgi:coproporphyrinogen III oxidase